MKYGERLEEASVPGWSFHNVDYNSLKHQIKVHTTKDQATTAIAIPGQWDDRLGKFEDKFYLELCSQHVRVGLFVTSKADEVSRRLRTLFTLQKMYGNLTVCQTDVPL
jgi:SPX domain protein involved in polyphosphate accumulation